MSHSDTGYTKYDNMKFGRSDVTEKRVGLWAEAAYIQVVYV